MIRTLVAIVGGGLAGLHAARLLRAANIECVLLEARHRLGGRILSVDDTGRPAADGFDLGPSWYWTRMQPAIAALIAELGLHAFAQASDGDVLFERMSREGPHRDATAAQEQLSFRLAGGTAALVGALARDIPRDHMILGTTVTAMTLGTSGVQLTIQCAGEATDTLETLAVDHVVAALPPRLLEATVAFTPHQDASTAQRWRETPTWKAPHADALASGVGVVASTRECRSSGEDVHRRNCVTASRARKLAGTGDSSRRIH